MGTLSEWVKFAVELLTLTSLVVGFYVKIKRYIKEQKDIEIRKKEEQEQEQEAQRLALESSINSIAERVEKLDEKVDGLITRQRINEVDRLRESILTFSEKLRVNKVEHIYEITVNSFNVIFDEYTKYKELGGNGYIDQEIKFIQEEFRRLH